MLLFAAVLLVCPHGASNSEAAPTVRVTRWTSDGRPLRVSATLGTAPSSAAATGTPDREAAIGVLVPAMAREFGADQMDQSLEFVDRTEVDEVGQVHLTYRQKFHGVPVFSGILKFHIASGNSPSTANGSFRAIPGEFDVLPGLTAAQAVVVASDLAAMENPVVYRAELVVVDPGWYGDAPTGPRLAYHIELDGDAPDSAAAFFIDAKNGDVLDRWSLVCGAIDREIYDAFGGTDLPGWLVRAEGSEATGIGEYDRLYDYIGDAYDFFSLGFGRDSYDDQGSTVIASAFYDALQCPGIPNAAWNFLRRSMYFCEGTTVDDVIAHEFTHGVTQTTANLIYQNQPGQLNESFSDIFGELIDLYNGGAAFVGQSGVTPWVDHPSGPGSDAPNPHRTSTCSLPSTSHGDGYRWLLAEDSAAWSQGLRDMWRPTCFNHPDRALSPLQGCNPIDAGGVHSGSGVLNHAFAMLCDGDTFNGQTISGIGPIKSGAIFHRALTTQLTVASDFMDAYDAIHQSAIDLIGATPNDPRTGLPSGDAITAFDAEQVDRAMIAVELNAAGGCGASVPVLSGIAVPACDSETVIYEDDFESGGAGWTVSNNAPIQPFDWVLRSSLPFGRPGTAWYCDDPNAGDCTEQTSDEAVHSLISPVFAIPPGVSNLTLAFTHFVETEPRFDGGVVSIRRNGGAWERIPSAAFYFNSYNTSLFNVGQGNTNPLAGEPAFTGVGGEWGTSLVDLGALVSAGDSIEIRFDFGKDSCFGYTGWFVDDVRVFACPGSADCNGNGVADEFEALIGGQDGPLFSQMANHSSGTLSDADPHPSLGVNKAAEDFQLLRPARIESLRVWGAYTGNTPVPDDFTVNFRQSSGGIPGAIIQSEPHIPTTRMATGVTFLNIGEHEYEMTLTTPLDLPAGIYFVEVFNNTAGSVTTWVWERALFGQIPGSARVGQSCATYCRDSNFNFSISISGAYAGATRGDLNEDASVNIDDVAPFVTVLLSPPDPATLCAADIDRDGDADGADAVLFAECVLLGGCP